MRGVSATAGASPSSDRRGHLSMTTGVRRNIGMIGQSPLNQGRARTSQQGKSCDRCRIHRGARFPFAAEEPISPIRVVAGAGLPRFRRACPGPPVPRWVHGRGRRNLLTQRRLMSGTRISKPRRRQPTGDRDVEGDLERPAGSLSRASRTGRSPPRCVRKGKHLQCTVGTAIDGAAHQKSADTW